MAFIEEELRNYSAKGWLGILGSGNRATSPNAFCWYEELTTSDFIVKPIQLWTDFSTIPPAKDLATAQANAVAHPTIITDYTGVGNAIHCTPTLNNKVFFATSVYNDLSTRLTNWIMPQLISRTDSPYVGFPSIGYMIKFYNGDPDAGGTEIGTTQEQSGAITGWFINFGSGAIVCASSFTSVINPADVWIKGFRYIGATGGITTSPGGVDGSVQYNNSGVFDGNINKFFWDKNNYRLGLGTNAPDNASGLHVYNAIDFSAFGMVIENNFNTAGQVDLWMRARSGLADDFHIWYNPSTANINVEGAGGTLKLQTNSASRMTIYGDGGIYFDTVGKNIRVIPSALNPFPLSGHIAIDSGDSNKFKYYDGSGWRFPITGISGWAEIPSFTRTADSTFTVTDNTENQAIFVKGRPIRYRAIAGTWRYGIVTNYVTGTVTIAGYPMTTSDDDELEYGNMQRVQTLSFSINGQFADGSTATLLADDLNTYFKWTMGKAYCVLISHRVIYEDTGVDQPWVNARINSNPVSYTNSNSGRAVSTSWVDTVVDISGGYEAEYGDGIEISAVAHGSNNDASNLTVIITFVLA